MANWTVDIRRVKRTEGGTELPVTYEGSITLDKPTEQDPVTMADAQGLLTRAMEENDIPPTAKVTDAVTLRISYSEADLTP